MNCPLLKAAAIVSNSRISSVDVSCDEGDCRWWNEVEQSCAILSMASWLPHLVSIIRGIYEKTPKLK